jgi:hypothetical protein
VASKSKNTSAEIRDIRSRAAECARQAANANTEEVRDKFLALEKKWLRLAQRHQTSRDLKK